MKKRGSNEAERGGSINLEQTEKRALRGISGHTSRTFHNVCDPFRG